MKNLSPICCVILERENGDFLLIKRARDPHKGMLSIIGGVGYLQHNYKTREEGVCDEVENDIGATPFDIRFLFSTSNSVGQEIRVFSAKVNEKDITENQKFVDGIVWCAPSDITNLENVAFNNKDLLIKSLEYK